MSERIDAVDALIASRSVLPPPAERERLRKAHGLTQDEVAEALGVRRSTLVSWENGKTEPRPPQRDAYAHLLTELARLYPPNGTAPAQVTAPAPRTPPPTAPAPRAAPAAPAPAARRPARQAAPARTAAPATAVDPRSVPSDAFADGPLTVLDGDGNAYCPGGLVLDCPARDLPALVDWALNQARLGAPRLHRSGKDADPLVVLTEAAAVRLGLPAELEDRRSLRLPAGHPVVRQLTRAKWQLTRRGFGPWARIHRPAEGGRRRCVQLAVLPWGALDARTWADAGQLPPAELARMLGDYAARVITPCGSSAVSGLELMTALRPPTRAVLDEASGSYVSGPMPGSLTAPVDPAPPEAPDEHPLVAAHRSRGHRHTPAEALDEEAFDWIRDPELLTDEECTKAYAVGLDVNTAFLAAANRLTVGLGPAVHVNAPEFDKRLPGSWLVDLSAVDPDPRLPNPFTPHGTRPTGPAWYATPTVAYAAELGHPVRPAEAWVRPEHGAYLDPWYARLSTAYKETMAELGVTAGMDEREFLAAMETHQQADPVRAAVLRAVKATVKGGIGKLRERPQGAKYRPGEPWPALERPTWRPDIRAAVISTARVNMHRKMLRMASVGLFPIAVLSDCVVYLSDGPSPLDFLPRTVDGKPLPGSFRLGVSPGMAKCEGVQPFLWAAQLLDSGHNPARHIKGTDAALEGE